MASLGSLVRSAREARGWTQGALAAQVSVSHAQISRIESGGRGADSRTLAALVRVLQLDPAEALAAVETAWPAEAGVEVAGVEEGVAA